MNSNRRTLLLAGLLPLFNSLAGCANDKPSLAAASPHIKTRRYTEQVAQLLISQDRKQLVVLGDQYHYVFEAPADLLRLLESPLKARMGATIGPLQVALDGTTEGGYQVFLPADLTADEAELAQSQGFMPAASPSSGWAFERLLKGKRYVVGNTFRAARSPLALNRSYSVTLEAEEATGQRAVEQLATPVAIASDGVLLIYYVALAPLLIPLIFLSKEKRPGAPLPASAPLPTPQP